MGTANTLESLRRRHYAMEALPDTIRVPALGGRAEEEAKPVMDATVDDVAFAILAVEAESYAIGERVSALRKLYALARQNGAIGADIAAAAIPVAKGGK